MASTEDLLNQAKRFVELHTAELSNWKKRVEELTAEVEKVVKPKADKPAEPKAEEPKTEEPKTEAPKVETPAPEVAQDTPAEDKSKRAKKAK